MRRAADGKIVFVERQAPLPFAVVTAEHLPGDAAEEKRRAGGKLGEVDRTVAARVALIQQVESQPQRTDRRKLELFKRKETVAVLVERGETQLQSAETAFGGGTAARQLLQSQLAVEVDVELAELVEH